MFLLKSRIYISSCILVVSVSFSSVGVCVKISIVILFLSWLFFSRCLCTGLLWLVRCSLFTCSLGVADILRFAFVRVALY